MNVSKAVHTIECPCCHGEEFLVVHDADTQEPIESHRCTHCQGDGWVMSEIAE